MPHPSRTLCHLFESIELKSGSNKKSAKEDDTLRGENPNYKVVVMGEFQMSLNGFLNFLGYDVWSRSFY